MKKILTLLVFTLTVQCTFGQACGIYRIKYVGKIKSESLKIENVKLPKIQFLHGVKVADSEKDFVEIACKTNELQVELGSHLTSDLYNTPESLLKFYKEKRENIPIIITVSENEVLKEIRMQISWDHIQIALLEDENFGNLFEVNLKEIAL